MGKRYCCVPGCSNTSDSVDLNGNKICLHRFPMSDKKKHIKKLWIQRLRHVRANLVVKDHTRVCSAHFEGTFTEESIPTVFPSKPKKVETPRRPLNRKSSINESKENQTGDQVGLEPIINDTVSISKYKIVSTQIESVELKDSETNTDYPDATSVEIQTVSSFSSKSVEIQVDLPKITIENIQKDDSKVRFYTGFVGFKVFWMFYCTLLKHGAGNLNYWEGEARSMGEKVTMNQVLVNQVKRDFLDLLMNF